MTKTAMVIGALVLMAHPAQSQDVKIMSQVDPMTDRITSMAYSLGPDEQVLGWRCDKDDLLAVLVSVGPSIKSTGHLITVQHQFPREAAETSRWTFDSQNRTAWMSAEEVPAFKRRALLATRVLIRITDSDGDVVATTEYPLRGLDQALAKLPCGKK
jgi:hypothetical protein